MRFQSKICELVLIYAQTTSQSASSGIRLLGEIPAGAVILIIIIITITFPKGEEPITINLSRVDANLP